MSPIRIGVVGAGVFGRSHGTVRSVPDCELAAIADPAPELPALELWRYEGNKGWHAPLSRQKLGIVEADPQLRQLQHFCRVVRDGEAPRVSGEDAMRTLAVVHAVHEAARTGRAVAP
jgi:predicted dehydrogenase